MGKKINISSEKQSGGITAHTVTASSTSSKVNVEAKPAKAKWPAKISAVAALVLAILGILEFLGVTSIF